MAINMFAVKRRIAKLSAVFIVIGSLSACGDKGVPEDEIFTLYQNAPSNSSARVGLATFDMAWGEKANQFQCQRFAAFLQRQWESDPQVQQLKKIDAGVANQRHWCEKGRYKK